MNRPTTIGVSLWLLLPVGAGAQSADSKARTAMAVWDTEQAGPVLLSAPALAGKNEWKPMPAGTMAAIHGEAVVSNGRIVAVLRRQEGDVELHGVSENGVARRLRLRLVDAAGQAGVKVERAAIIENSKAGAALEVSLRTAKGTQITGRFRLKRGEVTLEAEPGSGASRLQVEAPGRFVILPDFFADDIAIDAATLPLDSVELPSENFVLHLTGQQQAIAMCVFENRKQDVKLSIRGSGAERQATGSEIGFEGKKIWVALLEAPRIWHTVELKAADTGKVLPLDWKMPFAAQWRVDFSRSGDLTDSWEMLLQETKGGDFVKPSWLGSGDVRLPGDRRRWNTVLGTFAYPCWSDPAGQGYLQPLRSRAVHFQGPVVIYPIHRVKQTPLDAFTVVDVMRGTLGVGPCEHILDLEGQKSEYRGRATCGVRDKLTPIYAAGEQKKRRAEVDRTLDEGLAFVKHIRGRIEHYVEFGRKLRAYLAEQEKLRPEAAGFIAEMTRLTQEIDQRVAVRAAKIQTPAHVAKMNEEFRRHVLDYDGPDAIQRCKEYTQALVVIGDNQDELSAECRWVVKTLRQRAGILMALDPRAAPIAAEIRARTQEALRNPANHESARH